MGKIFSSSKNGDSMLNVSLVLVVNEYENFEICYESLLNQSYKNIELLVIDLTNSNFEKFKNLNIIKMNNPINEIDIMNCALRNMSGDLFCFINTNILCDSKMVEYLTCGFQESNADITISGFYRISNNNSIALYSNDRETGVLNHEQTIKLLNTDYRFPERNIFSDTFWGSLYSKDFIKQFINDNITEDVNISLLKKSQKNNYIANALYYKFANEVQEKTVSFSDRMRHLKNALKFIKNLYIKPKYSKYELQEREKKYLKSVNKNKIYLFSVARHDNSGDEAILLTEIKFLKQKFPDYELFIYDDVDYSTEYSLIKKYSNSKDIFAIHGGGNIGDVYHSIELSREGLIRDWKRRKIIIFPQTIYFTNSIIGKLLLKRSKKIFSQCKELHIFTREKISYDFAVNNYKNKIYFCPDIVLSQNMSKSQYERNGALICLRCDVEKSISNNDLIKIKEICNQRFAFVNVTDLRANIDFTEEILETEFNRKINQFKKYSLVITDRLHAMIFCAISGTPCFVLSNNNHKIKSTYELISNLKYIHYFDDLTEFEKAINEFSDFSEYQYDNSSFAPYYDNLEEILRKGLQ